MTTAERWQQVKEVLGYALELESSQRSAYLEEAGTGDPELKAEVERLLAVEDSARNLLGTVATQAEAGDAPGAGAKSWVGQRVGPYKIVEPIGRGGMGAVYRAVRADDQYQKQVAVKVIQAGFDSAFVVSRFKNERQILASLEHPNIAHMLDGGTTEDRTPYFVMELIEGRPIDEYCDRQRLPVPERLRLFLQVCAAVQFAHQRLIIHRDIKPGNILVGPNGVPKLLDFGIAKILDKETDTGPVATVTMYRALTPAYASPEQVKGEPITTASDVYSLGVVLYELLTGQHPYCRPNTGPEEMARAACETEPEKPSTVVRRAAAAGSPKTSEAGAKREDKATWEKLAKQLKGDLDNITLMALRKEPQRRYASVEQFAEDIRRHLENLPVLAREDTFRYRVSKFVARHKASVGVTALAALALIIALAVTLHEARIARREQAREQQRFNDVRKLAHSLIFEIHDSVNDVPGATAARALIAQRSLDYLDSLAREAAGEPSLESELATAYITVGDAQGQSYGANLGDSAGALASYRKALAIRETLAASDPDNLDNQLELARCENKVADKQARMGDDGNASANYRKALSVLTALVARDPNNLQSTHQLVSTWTRMAYVSEDSGDMAGALEDHRHALAVAQQSLAGHSSDIVACHDTSLTYENVGDLLAKTGKTAEGLETLRKTFEVCPALLAEGPNSTPSNSRGWFVVYLKMGDMLTELHKEKDASESYRKAMGIAQRLSASDPGNELARSDLAFAYESQGKSALAFRDPNKAMENFTQSVAIREQIAAKDEQDTEAHADLALSYGNEAQAMEMLATYPATPVAQRIERWRGAQAALEKSLKLWMAMRQSGRLPASAASEPEMVGKQIAHCQTEMEKLIAKGQAGTHN